MFSFIVPCYNVENYIDECVKSLLKQTYENYEIVLINDGSTDTTYEKCLLWSQKDSRIRLLNKQNGGLSSARNFGMRQASGQFYVFVDGDDTIAADSLSEFVKVIDEQTDVLITRLIRAYPEGDKPQDEQMGEQLAMSPSRADAVKWIMQGTQGTWPAPKYIVSNRFVNENMLLFNEGFLHEDIDWTSTLCCHAKVFRSCPYPWYFHRMQRAGSITNVVNPKRLEDVLEIASSFIDGEKSHLLMALSEEERNMVVFRLMQSVYASLSLYKEAAPGDKKRMVRSIDEHRSIFRYAPRLRHRLFALMMGLFGAELTLDIMTFLNIN